MYESNEQLNDVFEKVESWMFKQSILLNEYFIKRQKTQSKLTFDSMVIGRVQACLSEKSELYKEDNDNALFDPAIMDLNLSRVKNNKLDSAKCLPIFGCHDNTCSLYQLFMQHIQAQYYGNLSIQQLSDVGSLWLDVVGRYTLTWNI